MAGIKPVPPTALGITPGRAGTFNISAATQLKKAMDLDPSAQRSAPVDTSMEEMSAAREEEIRQLLLQQQLTALAKQVAEKKAIRDSYVLPELTWQEKLARLTENAKGALLGTPIPKP